MNLFGESQKIKQLDISYNTNKNKGIKLQYFLIGIIVRAIILKNGWELDHCTGGHSIYKKEGVKKTLSIAYKKCNRMVVQRLIKEFGLVT